MGIDENSLPYYKCTAYYYYNDGTAQAWSTSAEEIKTRT